MEFPHYELIPTEPEANIAWREEWLLRAAGSVAAQKLLLEMCREDVLFWLNGFCWAFEPRNPGNTKVIPWITRPHQVPVAKMMREYLGVCDISGDKSRGEGASWLMCLMAVHDCRFVPKTQIGLVSRSEDLVDNPDDPDSLMWKVDFTLKMLPEWMQGQPRRNRTKHTLVFDDNGSAIVGYAATDTVGSGGRKWWFGIDELSKWDRGPDERVLISTQSTTESRLIVATPYGADGAYYELMHEPETPKLKRFTLDWRDNPARNRGAYVLQGGVPRRASPDIPLAAEYDPPSADVVALWSRLRKRGFVLENCVRSPWYDGECDRTRATPQSIAQELDRNFGGSKSRVFLDAFQSKAMASIRVPYSRGQFEFDREALRGSFVPAQDGQVLLWTQLGIQGQPPRRPYAMGMDVAAGGAGSHSSNSVCEIVDLTTMEQVLEFATNSMPPADFADWCIACGNWFHEALMYWEHAGPGTAFTHRIAERGYSNVLLTSAAKIGRHGGAKLPGWRPGARGAKERLFEDFSLAVRHDELILRSRSLVEECGQYVRENGEIIHPGAKNSPDGGSRGLAHGDRVIAMGLALAAAKSRPVSAEQKESKSAFIPRNCMAYREQLREEQEREAGDVWDARSLADLARG